MGMGTGERGWRAPWLLAGSCPQLGQHGQRGQNHLTSSGLSGMISWLFWKAGGVRERSWGTGLLPAGKEVTEVCNKAETRPKLRSGVM